METALELRTQKKVGPFGAEAKKIPRMQGAGSVEEPMPTKEAMTKLGLLSAKIALQLLNREGSSEVGNITRLVSKPTSDADELRLHLKNLRTASRYCTIKK